MFSLVNRGELAGVVESEFEQLIARIRGLWLTEHKEDGSHKDITADSLTTTGNIVSGGSGTFDENVIADADGRPVEIGAEVGSLAASSGIRMTSVASGAAASDWSMESSFAIPSGAQSSLVWQDHPNRAVVGATSGPMLLGRNTNTGTTPAEYTLYPGGPTSLLNLGTNSPGYRINSIVSNLMNSIGGYTERFRSYTLGSRQTYTHAAGDFTGDIGSWTVAAGDVQDISWTKIGNRMSVDIMIATSTIAGNPNYLGFVLPGPTTIASTIINPCNVFHGGVWQAGYMQALAGETFIRIYSTPGAAVWPNEVDTIWVRGQISFFVTG